MKIRTVFVTESTCTPDISSFSVLLRKMLRCHSCVENESKFTAPREKTTEQVVHSGSSPYDCVEGCDVFFFSATVSNGGGASASAHADAHLSALAKCWCRDSHLRRPLDPRCHAWLGRLQS